MKAFKLYPAMSVGFLLTVIGEIVAVVQAVQAEGQPFNWVSATIAALPLIGGALVHIQVIPVGAVEQAITVATTVEDLLQKILDRLKPEQRARLRQVRRTEHSDTLGL